MEDLLFVGPGRLGLALAYALHQAEATRSLTFCGRRPDPPSHPLFNQGIARYVYGIERPQESTTAVLLTVPDDVLPEVAAALAARGSAPDGAAAFHLSGALGADPLAPLHARGYRVGSLHPLQSIAHPISGAERFAGVYFAISGGHEALAVARRLVRHLEGRTLTVPAGRRGLYHAAAVMGSNYLVTLIAAAHRLLVEAGAEEEEALAALLALARGTLGNLAELGSSRALTGPVERGDVETVDLHLRILGPAERRLYAALGAETLRLLGGDLEPDAARELLERFERER